jgi:hypothetical protein
VAPVNRKLARETIWSAAVILAALVYTWLLTSPSAIALINWDNAAYIAEIASGGYDWSHLPWSSHLGVGQAYKLGVWLAQLAGGSVIDGFRLLNALVFAATCWTLFDTSRRICGSPHRAVGHRLGQPALPPHSRRQLPLPGALRGALARLGAARGPLANA